MDRLQKRSPGKPEPEELSWSMAMMLHWGTGLFGGYAFYRKKYLQGSLQLALSLAFFAFLIRFAIHHKLSFLLTPVILFLVMGAWFALGFLGILLGFSRDNNGKPIKPTQQEQMWAAKCVAWALLISAVLFVVSRGVFGFMPIRFLPHYELSKSHFVFCFCFLLLTVGVATSIKQFQDRLFLASGIVWGALVWQGVMTTLHSGAELASLHHVVDHHSLSNTLTSFHKNWLYVTEPLIVGLSTAIIGVSLFLVSGLQRIYRSQKRPKTPSSIALFFAYLALLSLVSLTYLINLIQREVDSLSQLTLAWHANWFAALSTLPTKPVGHVLLWSGSIALLSCLAYFVWLSRTAQPIPHKFIGKYALLLLLAFGPSFLLGLAFEYESKQFLGREIKIESERWNAFLRTKWTPHATQALGTRRTLPIDHPSHTFFRTIFLLRSLRTSWQIQTSHIAKPRQPYGDDQKDSSALEMLQQHPQTKPIPIIIWPTTQKKPLCRLLSVIRQLNKRASLSIPSFLRYSMNGRQMVGVASWKTIAIAYGKETTPAIKNGKDLIERALRMPHTPKKPLYICR
jgi:hypothetical protein